MKDIKTIGTICLNLLLIFLGCVLCAFALNSNEHSISIQPKSTGFGSNTNGGELLFLALATCYCNDIYREAAKREIKIKEVEVEVEGNFYEEGKPARNVTYRAKVIGEASKEALRELVKYTDKVAEIQNTLRVETPITSFRNTGPLSGVIKMSAIIRRLVGENPAPTG